MGKVGKNRKPLRYNPMTGKPEKVKYTENEYTVASVPSTSGTNGSVENIVVGKGIQGLKIACKKLNDDSAEEKVVGLNILAAFCLDKNNAQIMIENQVAHQVAPLMLNTNPQVRLASTGVLCNLSDTLPDHLIDSMVKQEVLKYLFLLMKNYLGSTPPPAEPYSRYSQGLAIPLGEADVSSLVLIYSFNILSRLCEASEDVVAEVNSEGAVNALLTYMNPDVWGYPVSNAVAECLLCLTENNPDAKSIVLPHADSLVERMSANKESCIGLQFCALVSGILLNLRYCSPEQESFGIMFEVLSKVLGMNLRQLCQGPEIEHKALLCELNSGLSAQLLALEVLSNLCCPDDGPELDDSVEAMDMEAVEDDQQDLHSTIVEAIHSCGLAIKTLDIVNLSVQNIEESHLNESDMAEVNLRIQQLNIRAMQCLQNLSAVCDFGDSDSLFTAWLQLLQKMSQTINNEKQEASDSSYLEAASGAMRGLVTKLCGANCQSLNNIGEEHLNELCKMSATAQAAVKSNLSQMLGTLACHLIQQNTQQTLSEGVVRHMLESITNIVLQTATSAVDISVSATAFDVLIDIYSDDKTDVVADHLKLVDTLKPMQSQFEAKYKKQKKKLRHHRALVVTVRDNLCAFIEYKQDRLRDIASAH